MAAPSASIPTPGTGEDIIQLTDEGIAEYIEFPEDTFFVESLAQNAAYKKGVAYVPAQQKIDGRNESHIYEIRPGMKEAKHVLGPCAVMKDDHDATKWTTDATMFGSCLSKKGILYMCAFNRNSIVAYDLENIDAHKVLGETGKEVIKCKQEIIGTFAPNDVCLDPDDESILYVAGGTLRDCCMCSGAYGFSNPAFGQIYKVELGDSDNVNMYSVSVHVSDLRTLAGIEVVNGELWTAQLYNIITNNLKGDQANDEPEIVWQGNDGKGMVWLADNVDIFDSGKWMLIPAYNTVPEASVARVMKHRYALSAGVMAAQIVTAFMHGESIRQALWDPEVSLQFSNTFIKEGQKSQPIRLIFLSTEDNGDAPPRAKHFEVDLKQTREKNKPRSVLDPKTKTELGKREFFHEQVTHAAHLETEDGEGYVVCVNFEQPRILLLKDTAFRTHLDG